LEKFIQNHAYGLVSLGEYLTIIDCTPSVLFMSASFLKSAGMKREEIIGQSALKYPTPEIVAKASEMIRHERGKIVG
jgi:hypothetical protein